MSDNIILKKGLNLPISGEAAQNVSKTFVPAVVAIKPEDFKGLAPRLLVKEGDRVLAGSPVLSDKKNSDILVTSPVSGTVKEVVRGDKRKLLAVVVAPDEKQEYQKFEAKTNAGAEAVKETLLASGLWTALVQRPYGIIADTTVKPKAIFVSAFSTAPLAPSAEFALGDDFAAVQAGISALAKLSEGGVHVSLNAENAASTPFHRLENCTLHTFSGKHPAGNVGVQISHISPIRKEETVWTVSLVMVAAIGKLFTKGIVDLTRKIAVTGPAAIEPSYVETVPGAAVSSLESFYGSAEGLRIVSGDVLSGKKVAADGFLGYFDNQVTILKEGYEKELLGWANPLRLGQFSSTRSYFSWLCPKKKYNMDTNLHGGPRAFLMSDSYYKEVLPMDIYPLYLVKACLAGEIEKMEQFGIYEVLPEDLALCEYIDPSKNYIQDIIAQGIDLMLKEMA